MHERYSFDKGKRDIWFEVILNINMFCSSFFNAIATKVLYFIFDCVY